MVVAAVVHRGNGMPDRGAGRLPVALSEIFPVVMMGNVPK